MVPVPGSVITRLVIGTETLFGNRLNEPMSPETKLDCQTLAEETCTPVLGSWKVGLTAVAVSRSRAASGPSGSPFRVTELVAVLPVGKVGAGKLTTSTPG